MYPTLSTHTWVSLSNEQRNRIRVLFKIPRTGSTEVHDGRIVTDGTTPQDFQHLTIEKMQAYLGDTSNDFLKLFDKVVAKIQDEIDGKMTEQIIESQVITPKKKGRPSTKNVQETN